MLTTSSGFGHGVSRKVEVTCRLQQNLFVGLHLGQIPASFRILGVVVHELGNQLCPLVCAIVDHHLRAGLTPLQVSFSLQQIHFDFRVGLSISTFMMIHRQHLHSRNSLTPTTRSGSCSQWIPCERLGWFGKWVPELNELRATPSILATTLELRATPSTASLSDRALGQESHVHDTTKHIGKW